MKLSSDYSHLPEVLKKASVNKIDEGVEVLLVTSAQNKTAVNSEMLTSLVNYAEFLTNELGKKAQIIITPSIYRNPTSPEEYLEDKQSVQWWVPEVEDSLFYGKLEFNNALILANSRVSPTAKEPLNGFEVMAKEHHLIIPHPKIHFKTLPRLRNKPLLTMSTTGFLTVKNYSESRAGDHAHEHHSYGFTVIEKKSEGINYIPRNVKVNSDGSFTDIIYEVTPKGVKVVEDCVGFVWGDLHTRYVDRNVIESTLDLFKKIKPRVQILHDVLDGATFNPHETKDMYIQRKKIREGRYLIEEEVEESLDLIEYLKDQSGVPETYVTLSNHDLFLDRLINNENWKKDLHNSPAYLKYAYIQQTTDLEEYGGIYGYLVKERFNDDGVKYITYEESLELLGYECGLHGDMTINGARGSYKSFARLNMKMIFGHGHSPVIFNGVTMVGVSCLLDQYYNRKSLSSWAHAHSIIHNSGKNQLLVFDDDYEISGLI